MPIRSERPTLLLVDDDRTFCQVLTRAFEHRGYAVDAVHDGAAALQLVAQKTHDCAIVDLRLPDVSGLKVVKRIVAADQDTTVVVLTGYGSIATAIEAIKLGATHYLTKPSDVDDIVSAFGRKAPDVEAPAAPNPLSVDRLAWEHIQRVLNKFDGNISATARALSMYRRTLQRKLNKHPPRL